MSIIEKKLKQIESENLDFKREFHNNKVDFIHDILCLANSDVKSSKFLIYGIEEKDGKPVKCIGVSKEDRYKPEQILNLLKGSNFNRLPKIEFHEVQHQGKDIFVLEILYTRERPYFLLKDKKDKETVAGTP